MADVKKVKLTLFLVASVLSITFIFYGYQMVYTPNILVDKDSRIFLVTRDATFRDVQLALSDQGIVNDMVSFSFLARLMDYDESIKPGRYQLSRNMSNIQAIRILRAGKQVPVNITFNNVRLIDELGEKITRNTSMTHEEFDKALDEFLATNNEGFTPENIIGMFIPNTYEVYYNISGSGLVERMHAEYKKFWNEERKAKAKALGLTPFEVSTLASIVQAENTRGDEAPVIAGLYLNRLKREMPLQADPTLVFASGDFALKRVLNIHKEIDSPYNTYKYIGLPPGPINMPTISSLTAVLNPDPNNYIYMCAKDDFSGRHNFASTYEDHLRNATRYQQALTREQKKNKARAQAKR
jgi:UPF0755 protein